MCQHQYTALSDQSTFKFICWYCLFLSHSKILMPTATWESGWIIFPIKTRAFTREPNPQPIFQESEERGLCDLWPAAQMAAPLPSPARAPSLRACSAWPRPLHSWSRLHPKLQLPRQTWWRGRRASKTPAPCLFSICWDPSWSAFRWWETSWSQSRRRARSPPLLVWVEPAKLTSMHGFSSQCPLVHLTWSTGWFTYQRTQWWLKVVRLCSGSKSEDNYFYQMGNKWGLWESEHNNRKLSMLNRQNVPAKHFYWRTNSECILFFFLRYLNSKHGNKSTKLERTDST